VRALALGLAIAGAMLHGATGAAAAAPAGADSAAATTVIVVRHAEKNPHPAGGDAGLALKGTLRAQELARVLADAGVSAVYVSQYGRARLTGEPLARAQSDTVRTYDANRNDLLAERIRREHAGRTVLVVGHGDSVLELIDSLTGERLPAGEAVDYDRVFVVTLGPGGTHRVVRLRYGAMPG
jgi:broad specificity phosphatase PhoE